MEYRGLAQTFREWMVRLHAQSFFEGMQVGAAALSDPLPGTIDEKINRAMEDYFAGQRGIGPTSSSLLAGELPAQRRGPGRPRKDGSMPNFNGKPSHDPQ